MAVCTYKGQIVYMGLMPFCEGLNGLRVMTLDEALSTKTVLEDKVKLHTSHSNVPCLFMTLLNSL